jgi:hypothetical protein
MKTKILVPFILLAIIAMLISALAYEIDKSHQDSKHREQFEIAVFVQLYQNLDRGETDATKRRLGALVTVQSDSYEERYGQETDTEFAPRLAEAKVIKTAFKAMSVPSK